MNSFVQIEIHNKNRWIYFTKYRWIAHMLFWLWVLLENLRNAGASDTFLSTFIEFFIRNLPIAIFFYFYCLFLIPYLFKKNRVRLFWLALLACLVIFPVLNLFYDKLFPEKSMPEVIKNSSFIEGYFQLFVNYVLNFLLFSMRLFFMEKSKEQDTLIELEKEKKEIEQVKLDLLKTNISPDFLMRSLKQLKNTAAALQENTPESILTFSDLMRYRLYRGRQYFSPLTEELIALHAFIDFIHLEEGNRLYIDLLVNGSAEQKDIASLALINILEVFCKTPPPVPARLKIEIRTESQSLLVHLHYSLHATDAILSDLQKYGENYSQLYGDEVKIDVENCKDPHCLINLSLPWILK